ncbi:MAG: hypothetical protein R2825_02510 [Saprospiraceae bacterium]
MIAYCKLEVLKVKGAPNHFALSYTVSQSYQGAYQLLELKSAQQQATLFGVALIENISSPF